jgi:hypothetical protein
MRRFLLLGAALALAGCESTPARTKARAIDQGYLLGSADAVKQLYWAKQALEAPSRTRPAGRIEYYTWEESGTSRDGRKLAPETVGVPVFVPSPVPAVP